MMRFWGKQGWNYSYRLKTGVFRNEKGIAYQEGFSLFLKTWKTKVHSKSAMQKGEYNGKRDKPGDMRKLSAGVLTSVGDKGIHVHLTSNLLVLHLGRPNHISDHLWSGLMLLKGILIQTVQGVLTEGDVDTNCHNTAAFHEWRGGPLYMPCVLNV